MIHDEDWLWGYGKVAAWIMIASQKIWKDAEPWIVSRVIQLVETRETATSGH